MWWKGLLVAMVTPFKEDGTVDVEGIRRIVEFHINSGTDVLVPCGTTGEVATLFEEEWELVIKTVVDASAGRIKVVAGAGGYNTAEVVERARTAQQLGVDGILSVCPYYNKPTQEGLYQHFKKVAESVSIPVIVYNVPSRTSRNIEPATIRRLSEVDNIVAIKEASGNVEQAMEIKYLCGDRITLLSGEDSLTLPLMSVGGKGIVSVVGNIIPQDVKALISAFERGDTQSAYNWAIKLFPISKAMFIETNPIPVKTAMNILKMPAGPLRLPLTPMQEENKRKLYDVLLSYGLIEGEKV